MLHSEQYTKDLSAVQSVCPNLDRINNSSVLVTGATGLICSATVDFLLNYNDTNNAGITVYAAVRNIEKAKKRFENYLGRVDLVIVEYDALKPIDWSFNVDYIIHGASPANPSIYSSQPVETLLTNLLGLNSILDYAIKHQVKRVLFISSSEVYGIKKGSAPYKDNEYGFVDILNPRSCYPSAKRACETLCVSYMCEHSVSSVIVRPGHVYGPTATRNDTRASSQFFFDVLDGKDIVMKSAGSQLRSYCYVVDCVSAMMVVLINGESGLAYNISNPNSIVTIRELAEEIAMATNRRLLFEKPTDEEIKGYNLMENSSLDSSLLEKLGWSGQFDLCTGVKHTISILRDSQ